ncbi:high frequency lysogenization protein HflD [Echinimonas agarilytica]|uniref:High frequency lysogenization protein HflD homolog n=1 Tax=Echinimonas agarilytica TaxID=1215918 RepID=A0AA41W9Y7_9GAMM|nr:high frequency lysogenization protein HflD [Echinimonas agarilytica]MCM2680774.1 high frequency lysogenization protein HflD [Echinimonas agarilytica]
MSHSDFTDRMIALSGVCQSAWLVSQVARKGTLDDEIFEVALNSILETSPDQAADVFGGIGNVRTGARQLIQHLDPKKSSRDMDVFRYSVSLLALQKRLAKIPGAFDTLAERIDQAKRQVGHFDVTDDSMVSSFAAIYTDVISPIGQRIQVAGAPANLQPKANQDRIRASLLAGVRAAVMWRQLGGNRLQFLLSRKKMLAATEDIIAL